MGCTWIRWLYYILLLEHCLVVFRDDPTYTLSANLPKLCSATYPCRNFRCTVGCCLPSGHALPRYPLDRMWTASVNCTVTKRARPDAATPSNALNVLFNGPDRYVRSVYMQSMGCQLPIIIQFIPLHRLVSQSTIFRHSQHPSPVQTKAPNSSPSTHLQPRTKAHTPAYTSSQTPRPVHPSSRHHEGQPSRAPVLSAIRRRSRMIPDGSV